MKKSELRVSQMGTTKWSVIKMEILNLNAGACRLLLTVDQIWKSQGLGAASFAKNDCELFVFF